MMVKMQHSVQRGCQGYCLSLSGGFSASRLVRWLLGFSACPAAPVASRLLGLPGGSSASRLLGFSACPAAPRLRGFSASRLARRPLGFAASRLLAVSGGFAASRLLGLSGGFSASRLVRWLLGFAASRLLGLCRTSRLRGFSASRLVSGFSASRLLVAFLGPFCPCFGNFPTRGFDAWISLGEVDMRVFTDDSHIARATKHLQVISKHFQSFEHSLMKMWYTRKIAISKGN